VEPEPTSSSAASDGSFDESAVLSPMLAKMTAAGPFRPAPKWMAVLLIAGVVGINVTGFITNASAPKLLDSNPLLLMALKPLYRYMVVASPKVNLVPYFLIGVGRLMLSDPIYFFLGWFYGDRAIGYFNDLLGTQTVSSTRRFFLRAAPIMSLFFAGPVICVLAGAAKVKPRVFFVLNLIGTSIIVLMLRLLSNQLSGPIKSFLSFNKRNNKWLLIISIVTTLVIVARVGAKQLRAAKNLKDDVSK
jgi:membrane protein DedA with SNARE-associated domain